jgi:hypothetical protein
MAMGGYAMDNDTAIMELFSDCYASRYGPRPYLDSWSIEDMCIMLERWQHIDMMGEDE